MRARHITILVALSLAIAASTLLLDLRFDVSLARARANSLDVEHDIASIETSLAAWRGAQAGYVSVGQVPSFWFKRAAEESSNIEAAIVRRQAATTSTDARAQYDLATSALGDLNGIDGRAREFATTERRFEASDLIFSEAIAPAQRLVNALVAAREAERRASEASLVGTRWLRLGLNAIALIGLGFGLFLFYRRAEQAEAIAADARSALDAVPSMEGIVSSARPLAAAPAPAPIATPAPATVNLAEAAELCVDLSRVMDGRDVPALFNRIAPVLGAKGIVLWLADASGALRPSLTLGYSERVVERLGTLQTDSDNVTSLAFRSQRSQAVNGSAPAAPGAIAVPLVTAAGCVGVLSAEVSRTRPDHETLAVARMIAAQIAALVAPTEESAMPEVRTAAQ